MAKLQNIEVEDLLCEAVNIEPTLLDEDMKRLPALLAYWNERFSQEHKAYLVAHVERQRVEARLYQEEKDAKAGAKATIKDLDAAVTLNPEFVAAMDAETQHEAEKARLYGVMDALRTKRDMLIQMGATRRVEMQGDPRIREESRAKHMDDGFSGKEG
jgi:predicted component of type VI protein secretion system